MSIIRREEDAADKWLREHDPYYTSTSKTKVQDMANPYETPEMEKRRNQMEIPMSNLSGSQRVQFKEFAGSYDEEGNFNL